MVVLVEVMVGGWGVLQHEKTVDLNIMIMFLSVFDRTSNENSAYDGQPMRKIIIFL